MPQTASYTYLAHLARTNLATYRFVHLFVHLLVPILVYIIIYLSSVRPSIRLFLIILTLSLTSLLCDISLAGLAAAAFHKVTSKLGLYWLPHAPEIHFIPRHSGHVLWEIGPGTPLRNSELCSWSSEKHLGSLRVEISRPISNGWHVFNKQQDLTLHFYALHIYIYIYKCIWNESTKIVHTSC